MMMMNHVQSRELSHPNDNTCLELLYDIFVGVFIMTL